MSIIYRYGCGCQGQNRILFCQVSGTRFRNFKHSGIESGVEIFDAVQEPFRFTYRTYGRVRTHTTGDGFYNGTYSRTADVYSQNETGDTIPADFTGAWLLSTGFSMDGTVRTREYATDHGNVTEVDTVSSEYSYADMETDVDALMAVGVADWADIDIGSRRAYIYEFGTGSIVFSDSLDTSTAGGASLFHCSGAVFRKQILRAGCTTLWRIQLERAPVNWDAAIQTAYIDDCDTFTDTQCSPPHEVEVDIPAATGSSPGLYIGRNFLEKMKACGD